MIYSECLLEGAAETYCVFWLRCPLQSVESHAPPSAAFLLAHVLMQKANAFLLLIFLTM